MNYKEFAKRVETAVHELRGFEHHSLDIRCSLEELKRVAKKHELSEAKLSKYVIIKRAPKANNLTSDFKGVFWAERNKKWRARITIDKKRTCLGYFDSKFDARDACNEHKNKHKKPKLS